MSSSVFGGIPSWYVIHTKPKQEQRAYVNLSAWGVEAFSPCVKEPVYDTRTLKTTYVKKIMFPQYLFARFDASKLLHKIRFTRGVHNVVRFGGSPVPLDDEVIECLKSRVDSDSRARPREEFKPGDKVVIRHGPLKDLVGIFELNISACDRVSILLEAVSYQGRILIERESIKKEQSPADS
ncbi:MAG: transcriptional antiterminator RfaH [Blastocatellia bacterium]|jgi:transcriptional antiterminator RfaH|nr:transcriptional antiterminator RfaH [Blastocatellia bacterium]